MANRTQNKTSISIGITPSLLNRIDDECLEVGMTRSSFIAMCISTYFRNQEAMALLNNANDLLAKAEQMQNEAQMNLWNAEVAKSES